MNLPPRPGKAVLLSYAPSDQSLALGIAGKLCERGATVFLDEQWVIWPEGHRRVLAAASVADEFVCLLAVNRKEPLPRPAADPGAVTGKSVLGSSSVFLDRPFLCLALAATWT